MKLLDMTLTEYLQSTASSQPTPGGGAVAAMTGASATALLEMLANLTLSKAGYEDCQEQMQAALVELVAMREQFLALAQADANVFDSFMAALRLPKETEEEKRYRQETLQAAYKEAAEVPFAIGKLAFKLFPLAEVIIAKGNRNAVTDGMIGAINARAALKSAFLNVKINLGGIKDAAYVEEISREMHRMESQIDQEEARLLNLGGY